MLSRIYKIIGYALLALTLFLPLIAREYSSTFQQCMSQQRTPESRQQKEESSARIFIARAFAFECTGEFLNANGNAITAVETGLIAFFTFTLWGATRAQRAHDREVNRAYVSGGGPLVASNLNMLAFTVDNYGKTPAIMLEYAVEFCPLNAIPPVPVYYRRNYLRTAFRDRIAPGTMGRIIAGISIPNIPRPLLAYGRYWFLDIWKIRHTAGFVLVIEANTTHSHIPLGVSIPRPYTDWD
jgi:hypothetical protein